MPTRFLSVLFIAILFAGQSSSQEDGETVFHWPLNPSSYWVKPDKHVWYFDEDSSDGPPLFGYHAGEDWNEIGTVGNEDCGAPIRAVHDGFVVASGSSVAGGQAVVVRHVLPDGSEIYMTFRHCQLGTTAPTGPIEAKALICNMGNTGTGVCHMHWDLTSDRTVKEDLVEDTNPWYDGPSGTSAARDKFEFSDGIAKYGAASLFLDDWGHDVLTRDLSDDIWEQFIAPGNIPSSVIFLRQFGTMARVTLAEAISFDLVELHYIADGAWQLWEANSESFLQAGETYRIRLDSDIPFSLIVPIPGHNQTETRARMEMIQWANQEACTATGMTACFSRVETRGFTKLSPPYQGSDSWDLWSMFVEFPTPTQPGTQLLLYAAKKSNPLLRCVLGFSPVTGFRDSSWTQLAPGAVYATPSETLRVVPTTDNLCNELL